MSLESSIRSYIFFLIAVLGEISGCYTFWVWLRLGKSILWIIPGVIALITFAAALTRVDVPNAGRAYAAYGGIYILSSILWLWLVEGVKPDRWDLLGMTICLGGTAVIMFAPHQTMN